MKNVLFAIPTLALLLLAAHYLRQGDMGMTAAHLGMIVLLVTWQDWVRLALVAVLALGAYEWAGTAVEFIRLRMAMGGSWARLAAIIAGALMFNLVAMGTLFGRNMHESFGRNRATAHWQTAVFCLTILGLGVAQAMVSFPILLLERFVPGWGELEILGLAVYGALLTGRMLGPRQCLRLRPRVWALFSFVFFLQLCLGLLGLEQMLMTGSLHLPVPALIVAGPVFRGGGYFMLFLFLSTILLVGPAWCSHLCYVGAWDDLLSRRGAKPRFNEQLETWTVQGRVITLIMVLAVAVGLRLSGTSVVMAGYLATMFGLVGVGAMLWLSRRSGMMVHCSAYCPIGIVSNVLGRISPWRIRVGEECDACGACFSRCRYNALSEATITSGQPGLSCTLCGDCVSACAKQQIGYSFPGLSAGSARALFLTLVISLHAVFLGVARI